MGFWHIYFGIYGGGEAVAYETTRHTLYGTATTQHTLYATSTTRHILRGATP